MGKARTSRKHESSSVDELPSRELAAGVESEIYSPTDRLKDRDFIWKALAECLADADEAGFKEVLKSHYDAVNPEARSKTLSRRTYYDAISKKGNPSLRTIMALMKDIRAIFHSEPRKQSAVPRTEWKKPEVASAVVARATRGASTPMRARKTRMAKRK